MERFPYIGNNCINYIYLASNKIQDIQKQVHDYSDTDTGGDNNFPYFQVRADMRRDPSGSRMQEVLNLGVSIS